MEFTDYLIDDDSILERVDEYTLYCHYLEFQPDIKVNYKSPLRNDDENASFGIFPSKKRTREFLWKDSGGLGDSGDIFKLVQLLYGYGSRTEAVNRVKSDFNLGSKVQDRPKIVKYIPIVRNSCDIRIRIRDFKEPDFQWWQQFNISRDILQMYNTAALYCYWLSPSQRAPMFATTYSYAYRIYDRYQLYFPLKAKGEKFRNDLKEEHILGFQQLTYSTNTLIVTKSMKDVKTLRSFGYDAVSPRSENVPFPDGAIDYLDKKYSKKLVLFDNDMKHRGEWYPWEKKYVPIESGTKDISDFTKKYGPQKASELLQLITY